MRLVLVILGLVLGDGLTQFIVQPIAESNTVRDGVHFLENARGSPRDVAHAHIALNLVQPIVVTLVKVIISERFIGSDIPVLIAAHGAFLSGLLWGLL